MFIKMYFKKEDCVVDVDPDYYIRGVKNDELVSVTINPYSLERSAKRILWSSAKVKPYDLLFMKHTYFDPTEGMKKKRCYLFPGEIGNLPGKCLVEVVDEYGWRGHVGKSFVKYEPDPIVYDCEIANTPKSEVRPDGLRVMCYTIDEWIGIKNYVLNDEKVTKELSNKMNNSKFAIKEVKFNGPATVVFWEDGTKTVVKCGPNDIIDYEKGLAMAISKKALGNTGHYYETFKKYSKPEVLPTEGLNRENIELAYQVLYCVMENQKATKSDMNCAIDEALGYLGEVLC